MASFNDHASHPPVDFGTHRHIPSNPLAGPFSYPELDEFAAALCTRWLNNDHSLHGPHDFHTLNHYLGLYVLARKFEIEQLQNTTMDLVRHYYHSQSMTAPPFRVEYVYANTSGSNYMRDFLVATAAYRALSKGHGDDDSSMDPSNPDALSEGLKDALRGGGDLPVDFCEELVERSKDEMEDPRKGDNCKWHQHSEGPFGTMKCAKWSGFEAYETH